MTEPRALVVWYSRTGRTGHAGEAIARALADAGLGVDLDPLVDPTPRDGRLGYARCSRDALLRRRAKIAPPIHDPSSYALVVIGTPVWNVSPSAPVRAYLARERARLARAGRVALFLTHGGFQGARVMAQLGALLGRRPAATLMLRARHFARGEIDARVRGFVATLGGAAPISDAAST